MTTPPQPPPAYLGPPSKRYIVSFDLNQAGRDYTPLFAELLKVGGYRVMFSQWILRHHGPARMVAEHYRHLLDANDRMLVICLDNGDWAGWNLAAALPQV